MVCQKIAQLQALSLTWKHQCCCNVLTSTNGQTVSSMAVPELECDQEEADTHLFLHAQHAASSRSAVVPLS